jgi:hypothetical protein
MTKQEQDEITFQILGFVLQVSFTMALALFLWWGTVSFIRYFWFHPLF